MRDRLNSFVFLLVATFALQPAHCFSSFDADGGNVHEQITKEALSGIVSDTNLAFIVKAVNSQDAPGEESATEPRRHFDDGQLSAALSYIDREKKKALNYAADADTDAENRAHCLKHFGMLLHTAQDFYSRSNYLEIQLEDGAKRANPYSIEVVDWAKVPDGYVGSKAGDALTSGKKSGQKTPATGQAAAGISYQELNKDNAQSTEAKKTLPGTNYFNLARALAVRETQRQWTLFEALIRGRYLQRADAIISALKQASPAQITDSD
jgi:hypothetical protein